MTPEPVPPPDGELTDIETTDGDTAAAIVWIFVSEAAISIKVLDLAQLPSVAA